MFGLFPLLPAAASLILGIVYVALGEASIARKRTVAVVFLVAVYLQFLTRHAMAGMLLQITLALGLAVWRKTDRA